ncbi:HET-domain-containing protein, partial [Karstenula rhodostoma CBS 690.94]
MRLLNTNTLVLHSFVQRIPPYVILSHTWGDGEVTFDDIHQDHAKNMQGYSKIIKCCEQAVRDRYKWTWIDTCCIDKRSSSELSEVINSMYKWYWDAEIYYAFLSDLTSNLDNFHVSDLRLVRWFTRGWCLQELLAPAVVEFYNADWVYMGTKSSAVTNISARTGIDKKYLSDRHSIEQASIATRFSWASCRETTRPEDIAYCLLGLVDVNMPLLYGEGDKAFYRLQLELVQKSNEHTIFAWNPQEFRASHDRLGMLAPHPLAFSNASRINVRNRDDIKTFEMTNSGLRITLNI